MRGLRAFVAIGSLLFASAVGQSFIDSADFRGRALEDDEGLVVHADGEEKRTQFIQYTTRFNNGPGTYAPDSRDEDWEPTDITLIGLAVGGACTLIFFIFATVNIIIDEVQRHADFSNKVTKVRDTLRDDYGVTEEELEEMEREFMLIDAKGDQFDAEEERRELAEIN